MFDSEMSTHFDNLHKAHILPELLTVTCFPELSVAAGNL